MSSRSLLGVRPNPVTSQGPERQRRSAQRLTGHTEHPSPGWNLMLDINNES